MGAQFDPWRCYVYVFLLSLFLVGRVVAGSTRSRGRRITRGYCLSGSDVSCRLC